MEIDITSFFENAEPWKFSHSIAEGGPSAGSDTWRAALSEAAEAPRRPPLHSPGFKARRALARLKPAAELVALSLFVAGLLAVCDALSRL